MTRYAADVQPDDVLHAVVLRSPVAYGRIARIDTTAARTAAGVKAVLTGGDIADRLVGRSLADIPVLCRDVVRFVGDPVAAVAAETRDAAERALSLIEVEYEEIEPVLDPHAAIAPSAPVLHPRFSEYVGAPKIPLTFPNICAYNVINRGDVEAAFANALTVHEHRYSTPMQHQGYLEPQGCTVSHDADGRVHVWASNKAPFLVRAELARILDVAPDQIILEPTYVGGDFGGKGGAMEVPLAALLSRATGRPVRMVLSGSEEFTSANPRHAAHITIRSAVGHDGCIVARDIRVLFDGGAYAGYKPIPGGNLAAQFWSAGPYTIPNVRFESMVVYTNHVPAGHMRAPGIAQVAFAEEVDIDRVAHAMQMDPLAFRERHALAGGGTGPLGETWRSVGLAECLTEVRRLAAWDSPRPPHVGRGLAISHCAGGMGVSHAVVEVSSDARLTLRTGVSDQGSGAHTVLLQIVADEVGVAVGDVDLAFGGTDSAPFDSGSSASRVTYVAGLAAQRAAASAREQLRDLAAEYLGCTSPQVEFRESVFVDVDRPANALPLRELAARGIPPDAPLVGRGEFQDFQLADTPSFAAAVAEVEVDVDTGEIGVRKVTSVYDVGTVINPIGLRGQLEGGLIQGLGFAMIEDLRLGDGGRVAAASLADYKLPTCVDVPVSASTWITDLPGSGPFGAKSIGELTTPLLPAAISNAVFDAVGVRITNLPITAEKVFDAIHGAAPPG